MTKTQTARRLFQTFKEATSKKSILQRVREFQVKSPLLYETEEYLVKTAEDPQELMRVLELRHEIFVKEWQGRQAFHGMDVDSFDFSGDHLMIVKKSSREVVGTYRLLCSKFTDEFYSESEFDLGHFLGSAGTKLELGRACVRSDYRTGATIDLLWKGLSRYIDATSADYLFGCASLKTIDPALTASVFEYFSQKDLWKADFSIRPVKKYTFKEFSWTPGDTNQPGLTPQQAKEIIPPLLRSYIHAGAAIYGQPALDKLFQCIDILTILDMSHLNPKFRQRFFQGH